MHLEALVQFPYVLLSSISGTTYGLRGEMSSDAGFIGRVLGKHPDVVGRWARSGAERRASDAEFAKEIDALDSFLAGSTDP
jgi:hypothetical protein